MGPLAKCIVLSPPYLHSSTADFRLGIIFSEVPYPLRLISDFSCYDSRMGWPKCHRPSAQRGFRTGDAE